MGDDRRSSRDGKRARYEDEDDARRSARPEQDDRRRSDRRRTEQDDRRRFEQDDRRRTEQDDRRRTEQDDRRRIEQDDRRATEQDVRRRTEQDDRRRDRQQSEHDQRKAKRGERMPQEQDERRKSGLDEDRRIREQDRDRKAEVDEVKKPHYPADQEPSDHELDKAEDELPASIRRMKEAEAALEASEKAKEKKEVASFEYSGKLAAETNSVHGIPLLFAEPIEARKPTVRWRLYVFKDGKPLDEPLLIFRQSAYLFGRERKVADIPIDHPSCSKQHAVLQYRLVDVINSDETVSKKVKPYLMDLASTNGTFLNDERLDAQRYYELFEKDTIRFGNSSREYVLLHENSA